jgi:glycosyltransferase involved in cell wall biosynthesis
MSRVVEQRLAVLLPDLGGGGAERVALAMLQGILDRGYKVDLVLASRSGALLPLVPDGVEIIDLGAKKLRGALFPLARYLRDRRPYAMHVMMWPMPLFAVIARAMARVDTRLIGSEHTNLSTVAYGLRPRLVRAVTRRAYLKLDALIAVSKGVADDLSAFINFPRSRISVIYNPLLLPDSIPAPDVAKSKWPAGTRRLLAVGELKIDKNYPLMLRAIAKLRSHTPVSLLILGEGSLLHELEQRVVEEGLKDAVIFAGFDNDVWPYYAAAELFILSSDTEGFGNVLVEAMHAGVPVVSTDCRSGPSEVLDGGRFGTLVPCGDDAALADAISAALKNKFDALDLRARAAELSGAEAVNRHMAMMIEPYSCHD